VAKQERQVDPNVKAAEDELRRSLGCRVVIKDRNGRGKIQIEYKSLEDFDRVITALK
jgi:ParB family chromosome partitioning protein